MYVRGCARITTACVLALWLGMHWTLLQTVAWTGMVINYSQCAPLREAISKTFDGRHPCPLCNAIQKGRAEEQNRPSHQLNPTVKLELAVVWEGTASILKAGCEQTPVSDTNSASRQEAPPKPRPRLA